MNIELGEKLLSIFKKARLLEDKLSIYGAEEECSKCRTISNEIIDCYIYCLYHDE